MTLPHRNVTRAVIQRYARLIERFGSELGRRPLVLPNGAFFPDPFEPTGPAVARLVARMQAHAGMLDIPMRASIVEVGATPRSSSCASGCGVPQSASAAFPRLSEDGDGWWLQIPEPELRHPVALTTNLARSLAYIFLVETQREGERPEPPVDVTADFLAVALGFGPLLLEGSYVYAKGCSGPQIASVTKVPLPELSIVVGLFALLGDHSIPSALRALSPTQRAMLDEACVLLRANDELIDELRERPAKIALGGFELEEARGFLSGFFKKRRRRKGESAETGPVLEPEMTLEDMEALLISMPPSSRAGRARNRTPSDDDLSDLVAESLREASA